MHVNVTKSNGSASLKCQLYPVEGRTIRKVMGGGGGGRGIFEPQEFFFVIKFLVEIFLGLRMNIF